MGFIKSYSNYVVQKKHQLLNNGTVFERDFSTVGGIGDTFNSKHRLYRQGSFVYSINDDIVTPKVYTNEKWEKNGDSEIWTQDSLFNTSGEQGSLEILLKQDYYKLKDFAYYGSCVELIRSSINDIIRRFPGEMNNLQDIVMSYEHENGTIQNRELSGETMIVFENPFNINLHLSENSIDIEKRNDIKYFQSNIDKYNVVINGSRLYNITNVTVTELNGNCILDAFCKIQITMSNRVKIYIYGYYDENGEICYVCKESSTRYALRPKEIYYKEFMKSLDSFQKLLLNKDSQPKYTTIFEVMEETDYGYKSFYKKFTFPVAYGGYNLDVISSEYSFYLSSLCKYGEFFDDLYCNNLYRQMTHESIKNFDWTDVLNREEETREDYIQNGEKIQKMLTVCGRELDEIKFYIDGIKNSNNITYNDSNNVPDYFLTDSLDLEGWDIRNVFPYKLTTTDFEEDLLLTHQPYSNFTTTCGNVVRYPNGYISGYWGSGCTQSKQEATINDNHVLDSKGYLRNVIRQYINEKTYTTQDLNNKFFKHLKLNSRAILQKKGTIEGIESILSLFGLRSKRWYDSLDLRTQKRILENNCQTNCSNYDYEIKEYVAITSPIKDVSNDASNNNNLPTAEYLIDFLNSTKNIVYNTYEYMNGMYVPYRGLPVRYYEKDNKRYLYPYFSNEVKIDGNPYYQMNGGWVHKEYTYSGNTIIDADGGYIDTNTHIPSVNNLQELLKINDENLYDGAIYYVNDIKGDYACINDEIYQVESMTVETGEEGFNYIRFFKVSVKNGTITLGKQKWDGIIKTYNENGEIIALNLDKFNNNAQIKIFIKQNNTIYLSSEDNVLINYSVFKDGNMLSSIDDFNTTIENSTNYFILHDKRWKNMLGFFGWNQLSTDSSEYKTIMNFKTNYKGNNPHVNGLRYDNGIEYIKYFKQLFKYAISKEAFNSNCYSTMNEYMSSLNYIEEDVGFTNLIEYDGCSEYINKYEDKKVHHFCDYTESGNTYYFTELDNSPSTYCFYDKEEYSNLKNEPSLRNAQSEDGNITCLDQIINIKNVDIIIKKYSNDTNENAKQRKYFDEVILHYLLQVIPSNVILNIKFE